MTRGATPLADLLAAVGRDSLPDGWSEDTAGGGDAPLTRRFVSDDGERVVFYALGPDGTATLARATWDDDLGEYVVDPGERGELLWAGDTVTPRYTREQLTADRFVRRPTGPARDERRDRGSDAGRSGRSVSDGGTSGHRRWLRSGDIGWVDGDGFLHVVDRLADMFTTGCGDVHPREIESVIYGLDGVESVAVVDSRDDVRGATVTAVVRPRAGADLGADAVVRACERELADHEVPARVEFVDEFPTTATGKVDRRRLRHLVQ